MKRQWLDEWYETPPGRRLWERERALLSPMIAECFGHHGVEVGVPAGRDGVLAECSLGHRVRLDAGGDGIVSGSFRGHLDMLALRPRSLAVVVLVHVLEYLPAPAAALASLEQALAPGGRLLTVCFDPISLPALRHRFAPRRMPWWPRGACTAPRCGSWLRGLQLDLEHRCRAWRLPLATGDRWRERLDRLDRIGATWPLGAVYVVSARKRERTGHAIRIGERLPGRILQPGGVPRPTSSSIVDDTAA